MTDTPSERPPGFWEAVEKDYFNPAIKLVELLATHELTKGEFDYHRKLAGWPPRNKAPVNREKLVGRIFWLINQHLAAMETNMNAGSHTDVAVLNQLVGSLGRLIRFETGSRRAHKAANPTTDLENIREKLVQRIEELKRG